MVNLDVAAYKEQPGSGGVAEGYLSPEWEESPLVDMPETWITPSQDIFAFGSLIYYLMEERDPPSWSEVEDMPESKEVRLGEIIRRCWMREFGSMDDVVSVLKEVIVEEGLELTDDGDDIVLDASVEQFEACGIFAQMIRHHEKHSS